MNQLVTMETLIAQFLLYFHINYNVEKCTTIPYENRKLSC